MNVQELIDALNAIEDKTLTVTSEGCDCDGDVGSVTIIGDEVYLRRGELILEPISVNKSLTPWSPKMDRFTEEQKKLLP
jgi:hypothetical protein